MSWKEKMKEWGGGDVTFLSVDAEVLTFAVMGEPILVEGKFKGQDTKRIGAPIMTPDGFSLLIVGKRVARRLSKYEKHFKEMAFELIRHGEQGDTNTTYELTRTADAELEKELLAKAKAGVSPEDLEDAIESACEIAVG